MKRKVLTGFSNLSDGDLDITAKGAVDGLDGNANFTFGVGVYANFKGAEDDYHSALGALSTGGAAAVVVKDEKRHELLDQFSNIAITVNQQANGDEVKLLSSGIPLAAVPEHHLQPIPVNLQVANGANGNMMVSVEHSPVGDHGTVFAYTLKSNTETDPNKWTQKSVNGHKATLAGLTPGEAYYFTAAYKGADDDVLVWAPPISKIVSD